jgi:hypothetical protein
MVVMVALYFMSQANADVLGEVCSLRFSTTQDSIPNVKSTMKSFGSKAGFASTSVIAVVALLLFFDNVAADAERAALDFTVLLSSNDTSTYYTNTLYVPFTTSAPSIPNHWNLHWAISPSEALPSLSFNIFITVNNMEAVKFTTSSLQGAAVTGTNLTSFFSFSSSNPNKILTHID